MLPPRDPPQDKDLHRLKVKGWKKIFQANGQEKESQGSYTQIKAKQTTKQGP